MQIAPTDFWLVWFQHLDHTQHMCCLLHISSRCTSVLNHYVVTWKNKGQDQQEIYHGRLAECFQWSFPNSIIFFFDLNVVLPCVVRICQNMSEWFLSFLHLSASSSDLRLWFAWKAVWVARSWEPLIRRRDLQGMCCFWMFLGFLQMLLMIAYDCLCYFIASHIVSLYFVYLIVSFHDVEECILFDFKVFFGKWRWRNLVEHRFAQRDPESTAAATGAIGAKVQDKMDKYKRYRKRMKKVCYCLFMFVAMLKTGIKYLSRGTQA